MAVMYLLTSRSSVITSSWQGASLCGTSRGRSALFMACAIFRVRSIGVVKPNSLLTTWMSENRFVITRACGLPLTLLNSTTGPPSRCFWMPVISRSGSTGTSVVIKSPCVSSHASAARSDRMSFVTCFSITVAIALTPPADLKVCTTSAGVVQAFRPARLRKHAFLFQRRVLLRAQPEPCAEYLRRVLAETRSRRTHAARRLAQLVRPHSIPQPAELRMIVRLPRPALEQLRIVEQVANRVDDRGVD